MVVAGNKIATRLLQRQQSGNKSGYTGLQHQPVSSHSVIFKIPAAPEIEGFTFLYWQPVAEPLTDTITIQAIYKADTLTSAPEVYINPANPAQKLIRNGQVYILKDDKTYTIMGAQIQ